MAAESPHKRLLTPFLILALGMTVLRGDRVPRTNSGGGRIAEHVVGRVEDSWGPIAGARVRWKGTDTLVKTDRFGVFHLPAPTQGHGRITAAAPGYFIAGVDADDQPATIRLTPIPTADCLDYQWIDPAPDPNAALNCANCHAEIYRQWQTGGHSRSATNRRLSNLYEGTDWHGHPGRGWSLLDEYPHGRGVCTACHAPSVSFHDEAFDDLRLVQGVSRRGVHCDYCHKISQAPVDNVGLAHGVLGVKLLRPRDGQIFFGTLDDDDRGRSVYSPLQKESRVCAACHEGTLFGVPVYTTYSEWLAGPDRKAGRTCQSCHMAPSGRLGNIAPNDAGLQRDPLTVASHGMPPGGRAAGLRQCLELSVVLQPSDADLTVRVQLLARNAGHRLPTGYIDRQLILLVEGFDRQARPLSLARGPRLPSPAGVQLAGRPGRLYAKVLTDPQGHSPAPFWRAGVRMSDTRLFSNRADGSRYVFPPETERVRVRVFYRRFWRKVAHEKQWPDDQIVVLDQSYRRTPDRGPEKGETINSESFDVRSSSG